VSTPETTCDCHPGQINAHGHTVAELAGLTPGELAQQWQDEFEQAAREAGWRSLRQTDDGTATPSAQA
jgi:hypothetical protein